MSSTTSSSNESKQFFIITHPFHPLRGKQFELIYLKQTWGEWRVFYYGNNNQIQSFPANWTDVVAIDPFVDAAQGKAYFRTIDLIELVGHISDIKQALLSSVN